MNSSRTPALVLAIALGAVATLALEGTEAAQTPETMQYQGRLTDSNGKPLEGTIGKLTFRLFSSGTQLDNTTFVWGEVHANVPVRRGVFSVNLGAGSESIDASGGTSAGANPLTSEILADSERWIQVQVNDDPPLGPPSRLGAVPFAITAGTAIVGSVPLGSILPWWPAAAGQALPDGYEFCNGQAVSTPGSPYLGMNKPDLMNTPRFMRGLPTSALPSYGGSNSFPTGGADSIGNHSHVVLGHTHSTGTLATVSDGSHAHGGVTGPENHLENQATTFGELLLNSGSQRDHTHVINPDGDHTHAITGSTGNNGNANTVGAGAHDNRPAFVGVAYIVRVK